MSKTKQSVLVPKLRFREFEGEWEYSTMRDVSKINQGLQIPISERFKEPIAGGYFYITNEFLKAGSKTTYYIKNPSTSVTCDIDDILMTRTGNTGMVVRNVKGVFHNNFFKIKYDNKRVHKDFLYLFLTDYKTQYNILKLAGTSTIPDLNHGDFYKIRLNLPTLPEQEKIAAFLTSVDDRIEQLKRKKSLLQDYKKGVMSRLFAVSNSECGIVNSECQQSTEKTHNSILTTQPSILRFKDNNDNPYPDWQEKKLGDVLTIGSGKDYKHLDKGSIPVYGSGGIMTHVNQQLYDGESVCIGRKGTIDKPRFLTGAFWTVDTLFYTHSFTCCLPKFIFYTFQQINWYKYNEASGVPSLSKGTIEKIKVQIPSTPEQTKIANYLSNLDTKINQVTQQITQTQTFKKGLLQQMFV